MNSLAADAEVTVVLPVAAEAKSLTACESDELLTPRIAVSSAWLSRLNWVRSPTVTPDLLARLCNSVWSACSSVWSCATSVLELVGGVVGLLVYGLVMIPRLLSAEVSALAATPSPAPIAPLNPEPKPPPPPKGEFVRSF